MSECRGQPQTAVIPLLCPRLTEPGTANPQTGQQPGKSGRESSVLLHGGDLWAKPSSVSSSLFLGSLERISQEIARKRSYLLRVPSRRDSGSPWKDCGSADEAPGCRRPLAPGATGSRQARVKSCSLHTYGITSLVSALGSGAGSGRATLCKC